MHEFLYDLNVLARVFECIECIGFGFKVRRFETWILDLWVLYKNRIFGCFVPKGISRYPCVGSAFRKSERVRMINMFIVKIWFYPK